MTNFFSPKFDWRPLKEQIQTLDKLPKGDNIPITDAWSKYVRLQKFLREHCHVKNWSACRDVVIEMAEHFGLSPHKAALLYLRLQRISSNSSVGFSIEKCQRAGDAYKELSKIRNSLNRLAVFSKAILSDAPTPRSRIAESKIENAAHFWTRGKLKEKPKSRDDDKLYEIESYGFAYRRDGDDERGWYESYDCGVVLRRWLRTNVLMSELVTKIIEDSKKPSDGEVQQVNTENTNWIDTLSAVERLVGLRLPELYENMTGNEFKIKQDKAQRTVDESGVKFVRMAMKSIAMKPLGPETIASHRKSTLKVKPEQK
jgi:hypothetical protein